MGQRSLLILVAVTVLLAGCGAGTSGTPTEVTPTKVSYEGEASELLLDAEGFGDQWEATNDFEADVDADGLASGHVMQLASEEGQVNVTLLIFETPTNATTHFDAVRDGYTSDGLQVGTVQVGEAGFRTKTFLESETVLASSESNLYVHLKGDVDTSVAQQMVSDQLDAITSS